MKIVLIGPTYPFRGGIAHYTTLLCKALKQKHIVKFISFKRQYPQMLFPGKSDRDDGNSPLKENSVEYIIDSLNPYTWMTAVKAIEKYNPDKIIFPWWVAFWTPQFWTILTFVKRNIKPEIICICHNTFEHESNFLKKIASKIVLSKADKILTHSKEETRKLKKLLNDKEEIVTAFLPSFVDLCNQRYTKEEARDKLAVTGNILLFFGFVRDYKGLNYLLDAMPEMIESKDITLLVVGEFWKDKRKYIDKIELLKISEKVKIFDEYVSNEDIGLYFAAADLVIQPYVSASGSAIAQLAYGFDRPVVATNVGSLSEVVEDGINGRIVNPCNAQELAEAILESLKPATLDKLSKNAVKTKNKFSWQKMARIITGEDT